MDFRIADTFTDSLARLTGEEQKSVKTTAFGNPPEGLCDRNLLIALAGALESSRPVMPSASIVARCRSSSGRPTTPLTLRRSS